MITENYKNRSVLLFLPVNDFNEQEYLVIVGALCKANLKVFVVSDANNLCVGSNGLKVKNDIQLYNTNNNNFGGFIIVGGNGTRGYWNNKHLHSIVQKFVDSKKIVGAICSAPIILAKAGVLKGSATCFPTDCKELEKNGIHVSDYSVVRSGNIITAKAPSSSDEFIKAFIYALVGN